MPQGGRTVTEPASPLGIPDFRRFWLARFASVLATTAMIVVIGWQVYDLARSQYAMTMREGALLLGVVGLAQFVPVLLLTPVAGWVADRFERVRVARIAMAIDLAIAIGLGLATANNGLSLPLLFAFAALHGTARVFVAPALSSIGPNIVPAALLPRSIAMSSIAWQSASVAGPALGGLLYAGHASAPYWFAAVSLSLGNFTLGAIRKVYPPPVEAGQTPLGQVVDGLRYVGGQRFLLGAITLDMFAVLFGGATALLPVYARDILHAGPEGLGLLRASPAIGAAAVALWFSFRPLRHNVGIKMIAAVVAFGIATVIFGYSQSFALSIFALALLGGFDMLSVYVRSSLIQLHTPDRMRGRVSAVSGLAISSSNELGEVQSGVAAALLGPVGAVVFGGFAAIGVAVGWAWLFPELRRARTFDPPETALSNAVMQEKPA